MTRMLQKVVPIPTRNNFDLLRFCLAMTVCLVHAANLSAEGSLSILDRLLSSEIAVQGFFAVSGFLIFMSCERSSTLNSYFEKRARRLVPAYVTVILLAALLLGAVSTATPYYFTKDWWAYLAANLSYLNFLHPELPGVFQNNVSPAVNGALWTLKIEIAFYVVVPGLIWAIRRFGAAPVIVTTYLLSSLYASSVQGSLANQLPGVLRYFMAGTACYYGWPILRGYWKPIALMATVILLLDGLLPLDLLRPAAIGVLVICAGNFCYLGEFGRHGDFSYGIYILHFPIIQTLVHFGIFKISPWGALILAVALAFGGAIVLWHCIERRFLQRRGHDSARRPQPAVP